MKILLVDDDAEDREQIIEILEGYDADIEPVNDAQSAIKRLRDKKTRYDKVICDGLEGDWTTVCKTAIDHGVSILLYTGNDNFRERAAEIGIPVLDKASSIRELRNAIFPSSGRGIEAPQQF